VAIASLSILLSLFFFSFSFLSSSCVSRESKAARIVYIDVTQRKKRTESVATSTKREIETGRQKYVDKGNKTRLVVQLGIQLSYILLCYLYFLHYYYFITFCLKIARNVAE